MTPTREELIERLESTLPWRHQRYYAEAISLLRSDSQRIAELEGRLNSPELHDFASGVVMEAAHQRERWGADHDVGKEPEDWFWLLGYLGGKALRAAKDGDRGKALHHTISTAAALANWHAAMVGSDHRMRPGIDASARGYDEQIDPALQTQDAWDWLASRINLELDWGEIEEGEAAWRIHRVRGGRNDREWELIATGTTPLAAVQAARKALPALQTQGADNAAK